MCLSKGLTGGVMPLGVTTCTEAIIEAFRSDDKAKTFYHGHSFTANPLACAAALASMQILLQKDTLNAIARIGEKHIEFETLIRNHKSLRNVRTLGTIIALELQTQQASSYFNEIGKSVYQYFLDRNILLRPLGNILYVMPPYCISNSELDLIYQEIEVFLEKIHTGI
jgi:adenosylmethionine-8-amino-7-oxononanoate aminotransferase